MCHGLVEMGTSPSGQGMATVVLVMTRTCPPEQARRTRRNEALLRLTMAAIALSSFVQLLHDLRGS